MITEDYVSFEIAKLLKEKGFDSENITAYYFFMEGSKPILNRIEPQHFVSQCGGNISLVGCPTLQMAIKWLKITYNICIVSLPVVTDDDGEAGCLWDCVISKKLKTLHNSDGLYESSESALSNGLKYVLENLI